MDNQYCRGCPVVSASQDLQPAEGPVLEDPSIVDATADLVKKAIQATFEYRGDPVPRDVGALLASFDRKNPRRWWKLPLRLGGKFACCECGTILNIYDPQCVLENVLPLVPYRQFVISLPIPMRYSLHTNKRFFAKVHRIIINLIHGYYMTKVSALGIKDSAPGSISFTQRWGSALNLLPTSISYVPTVFTHGGEINRIS